MRHPYVMIYEAFSTGSIDGGTITFTRYVQQLFNYPVVNVCVAVVKRPYNTPVSGVPIVCRWV